MENNLKKYGVIAVLVLTVVLGGLALKSKADQGTPQTSLTVTNTPPNTPSIAYEYVASDYHAANTDKVSNTTYPTNVGTTVTFKATASDDNNDQWKLAVCRNGVVPTVTSDIPACSSPENQLCVSSSFADSASENTCDYQTASGDPQSQGWYVYACDANTCSTSVTNQGSKSDGSQSPLEINHRPTFNGRSVPTADPGGTFTFTATDDSDPDTDTSDTVDLYVCKTSGFTANSDTPGCTGGTWCSSGASASSPSCDAADVPIQDGTNSSYTFIVDNHGFAASGTYQAAAASITVNNKAPSVTASTIGIYDPTDDNFDKTPALTLTVPSDKTTGFVMKFTASDPNGCQNQSAGQEIANFATKVYRAGVTDGSACSADSNNCYAFNTTSGMTCTEDVGSCSGVADTAATFTCGFDLESFADATDTGSAHEADAVWLAAVTPTDDDPLGGSEAIDTSGTPLLQALMYTVPETTIAYANVTGGSVVPGATSAHTGETTTLTGQGNTGLESKIKGTNMCTDYPTCASGKQLLDDGVGQQKYKYNGDFTWATDGTALTTSFVNDTTNYCSKPTSTTDTTLPYNWKIKVPLSQPAGAYTGLNTVAAIVSPSSDW